VKRLRFVTCLALAFAAPVLRAQTSLPIGLSGFNQDLIVGKTETGTVATTNVAGWVYYETGLASAPSGYQGTTGQGLPGSGGAFTSAANSAVQFQFASYTGSNTLVLSNGGSGTLTLSSPGSIQDIHFLVTVQGGGTMTVTLNFSNATSVTIPSYTSIPDWTVSSVTYGAALSNMGLLHTAGSSGYAGNLYLREFDYTLGSGDQSKTLSSISVSNSGGPLMFFGASATAIPEPGTTAALAGLAALGLVAVRRIRCRRRPL